MIRLFCNKRALLSDGRLVRLGPVDEVVEEYFGWMQKHGREVILSEKKDYRQDYVMAGEAISIL